jgi:uncharacterized PurR-regulated membrane protein YhhQ (DUF165 family)
MIKRAFNILDKLFGETIKSETDRIYLPIYFTITLCMTTVFFFDHDTFDLFGEPLHFSVGLVVFPLTFTLSNIIQDRYGRLFTNTVIRYAFLADCIFVFCGYALTYIGNREDYFSVFRQIPVIMLSTFFFVWLSNTINIVTFSILQNKKVNNFAKYSVAAIFAESSVSMISIPLMMYKNNLSGGALVSVIVVVFYKIAVTLLLSFIASLQSYLRNRHL